MKKLTNKQRTRKYYLHSKIKKEGIKVIPSEKTISLPHTREVTDYCRMLVEEFNYQIQSAIE